MNAAKIAPTLMTADEFLVWDAPGPNRWELVDGLPRKMAISSVAQGLVHSEATVLIRNHLFETHAHCRLMIRSCVQPRVRADLNVRTPDLVASSTPRQAGDMLVRDPKLMVEIVSPSNERDRWSNVWAYTTIPSVRDILVLHVSLARAELLHRGDDGAWPDNALTLLSGDTLTLQSIDMALPLTEFYRTL